jgi:hypothetical protein
LDRGRDGGVEPESTTAGQHPGKDDWLDATEVAQKGWTGGPQGDAEAVGEEEGGRRR